jgi:MFS transporter, PPP family, 3-phenylpropionic acid transporter
MRVPTFGFAPRVACLYAAMFTVYGAQLPYFPVWLDWRGLTSAEIAIITSAPLILRLIATPLISFLADRWGRRQMMIVVLAWMGLAIGVWTAYSQHFWAILIAQIIFAATWTSIMPLTEAVAMNGVKNEGANYGHMRLWGSIGFMAANLIGGWMVDRHGPSAAMALIVVGLVATVATAHLLLPDANPLQVREDVSSTKTRLSWHEALTLLKSPVVALFLVAAGAAQSAHAVMYVFGTLHWRAQGLSTGWCGLLWAIGIVAEIALLAAPTDWLRKIGALPLMAIGAVGAIVRWTAMGFDPPLTFLLLLQILHGMSYGASHLGAMYLLVRLVPDRQSGIGQALYATLSGSLAMAVAMQIAAPLYAGYGGRAYWAMAALGGISLLSIVLLKNRLKSEPTI